MDLRWLRLHIVLEMGQELWPGPAPAPSAWGFDADPETPAPAGVHVALALGRGAAEHQAHLALRKVELPPHRASLVTDFAVGRRVRAG